MWCITHRELGSCLVLCTNYTHIIEELPGVVYNTHNSGVDWCGVLHTWNLKSCLVGCITHII